jgi:hypothetical protein
MKKPKIKLNLNKETLQVLNEQELNQLNGGEEYTSGWCIRGGVIVTGLLMQTADNSWWLCVPPVVGYGAGIKSTWYQSGADTKPVLQPGCEVPKFLY